MNASASSSLDQKDAIQRRSSTAWRVIAVRKAGASFESPTNVRSAAFVALLEKLDASARALELLRPSLIEQLYAAIAAEVDRSRRNSLLPVKRAVFNERPVNNENLACFDSSFAARLREYNRLVADLAGAPALAAPKVLTEIRGKINALLDDPVFVAAVSYSCPWLVDSYRRKGPWNPDFLTNEERGIFSYASKFFSKANPFHIFASIGFPAPDQGAEEHSCEVVLDLSLVARLEEALLCKAEGSRIMLHAAPYLRQPDRFVFLVSEDRRLRFVAVGRTPFSQSLLAGLANPSQSHTLEDCIESVASACPELSRNEIADRLMQLVQRKVLNQYLVKDFDGFARDLLGIDAASDPLIAELQEFHLAEMPRTQLPTVHRRLTSLCSEREPEHRDYYYVNSYHPVKDDVGKTALGPVGRTLDELKPLFTARSNFSRHNYVIGQFLRDELTASGRASLPYMELVWRFLARARELVDHYGNEPEFRKTETDYAAWSAHLAAREGHLTGTEIAQFINSRPVQHSTNQDRNPVCFNGSFDFRHFRFYVSNVFADGDRFASRYLLSQRKRATSSTVDEDVVDVQVVAPFGSNRTYVAREFATGCGSGRFRHRFQQWIDFTDIEVMLHDQTVTYRDQRSGRRLRFHFWGFLLAEELSADYQLLLADHADFYLNPFAFDPSIMPTGLSPSAPLRVGSLAYGPVCLRHEMWLFRPSLFKEAQKQSDLVSAAFRVRRVIHQAIGSGVDDWYFRAPKPGQVGAKPRYLDLKNPASVQVFTRALAALTDSAFCSLTPMQPAPEDLLHEKEGHFLTELMIEV